MAEYDLDLREYWKTIKRRKRVVIVAVFLCALLSFIFARWRAPSPIYAATASVKYEKSTTLVGLFVEALSWAQWDYLASEAALIRGFSILEKVAKKMGYIPPDIGKEAVRTQYAEVIERLQQMITTEQETTEQEGKTNIINITAIAPSPIEAQRLANTVADVYRQENINQRNRSAGEATKFIEHQLKIVEQTLKESEERLKQFKEQEAILDLNAQAKEQIRQIASLQAELEGIEKEEGAVKFQLKQLERGKTPIEIATSRPFTGDYGSIIFKLNSSLVDLLIKKRSLLLDYTPAHPQVKEIDTKIADIRAEMKREMKIHLEALAKRKSFIKETLTQLESKNIVFPKQALLLARLNREVETNADLYSFLKSKYQEALIKKAEQIEEVSIVRYALPPQKPVNPPRTLNITFTGTILGMILGVVMAFIVETFDTTIKTAEEVEEFLGLPVIGIIPRIEEKELNRIQRKNVLKPDIISFLPFLIIHFSPDLSPSEAYKGLRSHLFLKEKDKKTFLITSSSPNEGKTAVLTNLALASAQIGKRTLLIESDFRKPFIHKVFGLEMEPGLVELLLKKSSLDETLKSSADLVLGRLGMEELMKDPGLENLCLITAGKRTPTPQEFLGSKSMKEFLDKAKETFDLILLDSPPILPVSDALALGKLVDGVILINRAGEVSRSALKRVKNQLESVGINIIGIVLNGVRPELGPDYYKHYYHYYESKA